MNVLSIQSSVAYGRVGNRAAVPLLERLGHEVWPVDTVAFSNHPGHGGFRGRVAPAAELAELLEGLGERGALGRCDAVLSGYLGDPATGDLVADAVARIRAAFPAPGDARPPWELSAELLRRCGGTLAATAARDVFARLAAAVPDYAGLDYRALGATGRALPLHGLAAAEARA